MSDPVSADTPAGAALSHHLIETAFDPYVLIDRELVIRHASPTVVKVVGWESEDLIGRSIVELLTPDSLVFAANGLREVDNIADEPQWIATPVQIAVTTHGGEERMIDVIARPVDHPDFDGYLVQLRPANPVPRYGAVTRAILDGRSEDEILEMLPALLESDIPGTRVALGIGWTGERFERVIGNDGLLDLHTPGGADTAVLDALVASQGEAYALTGDLSPATIARAADAGCRACWGAPVVARHPYGLGSAVVLWHWSTTEPGPIMRMRVQRLIDLVRLVLDWADSQRRLAWDVTHDRLTGLINRAEFMDRLRAAGGHERAVLFCDLDDFKPVNDRFGHRVGDKILRGVAERMRSVCAPAEVARLSGDEFAVLVESDDPDSGAPDLAEVLRQALADPIDVGDCVAVVGVSIGVACDPGGAASADVLIDEADRMLRGCKAAGKNTIRTVVVGA